MRHRRSHLVLLAALLTCVLAVPAAAGAAPFTVTDGGDAGTGGCTTEECTLREAVVAANALAGADTIGFSEEVFDVSLESALPDVTGTATIDGGDSVTVFGDSSAFDGLRLTGSGSTITGLTISNFGGDAVRLAGTGGHSLLGTTIEDAGGHAVAVASSGNTIGGVTGEGNTVIGAGGDGVSVLSGTGNRIRGNAMSGPAGLGIDLAPDGPTPNDALDADTGANDLQNFPSVTAALAGDLGVDVTATLASKASQTYTIDFYSATGCGGVGAEWLGSAPLTTSAGGTGATAPTTVAEPSFGANGIVATATDAAGNTSELGPLKPLGGGEAGGITPQCDAGELARAMSVDPSFVTGASWVTRPGGGSPAGTATAGILGYPTHGSDYAVLASGDVGRLAPGGQGSSGLGGGAVRGRHRPRRHDPEGRPERPGGAQLPLDRLPLRLRGVPGLPQLLVQRRVHRGGRHVELDHERLGDHRAAELRLRPVGRRDLDQQHGQHRDDARAGRGDRLLPGPRPGRGDAAAARQQGRQRGRALALPVDLRPGRHGARLRGRPRQPGAVDEDAGRLRFRRHVRPHAARRDAGHAGRRCVDQ